MATHFNVIINPFKQRMCVYARVNKVECETLIDYLELDEWHSFDFNGRLYDLHLLYEEDVSVSIYDATDGHPSDYNAPCLVKLTIRTRDEF